MREGVHEGVVEVIGVSLSNKGMVGGGLAGLVGWAAQINWLGLAGVLIALAGLLANVYFQHRREKREATFQQLRDKREAEESAARIAALRERCELP